MPDRTYALGSLESVEAGFCIIEVTFEGDEAVDLRFVEANAAFERQMGFREAAGRLGPDGPADRTAHWFDIYAGVARSGEAVRLETRLGEPGERWFDVHVVPTGEPEARRVAVLFTDISDRKRQDQALRESEERLEQALSAGRGIGTWDWDVQADRVRADARFAKLYGVDADRAMAGAPIADFLVGVHPDDIPALQVAIDEGMRTGGVFSHEYRLVEPAGGVQWVFAQGRCERAPEGTPLRFSGVSFDISERKRAEARQAALLALSDRLRDLSDPAEIAYAASEIIGQTLGVSRVGYGTIDKIAETIVIERDWNAPGIQSLAGTLHFRDYGSYIEDLKAGETVVIFDAETDPRTQATADALAGISARSIVNMPLVEYGQFAALLYANNAKPRIWSEDELALMREIAERAHVVTERVRAEEARRSSEEQFRVFAQAVPNQIWSAQPDGYLDWFNDQVYAYCGAEPGHFDGDAGWSEIVHPDDLEEARAAWSRCLETGEVYETEFRIRRADGQFRWFLVRAEPVHAADGAILRWVGTNTDIDDRRQQAAELVRLNDTLEEQVVARTRELMVAEEALRQSQKMEAVGQLTGGLAHDFNNLLTGITGGLELLGSRISQGRLKDVERYLAAAQGSAKRAAALTHRLLAFSRRQTLDPKPTDLNELVGGLGDLVRQTAGPTVQLEVATSQDLWLTRVDPNQIENAILNLCINARDAMPDGGVLTITTANKLLDTREAQEVDLPAGPYVTLCVSDTGTGMTPEVAEKAFDPFFTTKPLGLGTGLGLSMVYGFTRQSGGQTVITSDVGAGTTICIYLPQYLGERADDDDVAGADAALRADDGETVLVVDDEPTIRMLVVEILEELGYAAIEAADGASGLKVLQSDVRIDLLVSDVGLPGGMNGRQMADAARATRPCLKVLFITGYAEHAVIGNGHLEPGMHVLPKPFTMETLATRIKELIAAP